MSHRQCRKDGDNIWHSWLTRKQYHKWWRINRWQGKWPVALQGQIFKLLADLLKSGFSVRRAIAFTVTAKEGEAPELLQIQQRLAEGMTVAHAFRPVVSANLFYQLALAEQHGQLQLAFADAAALMTMTAKQKRELIRLLAYPVSLLVAVLGLTILIHGMILPQLQTWQGAMTRPSTRHHDILLLLAGGVLILLWLGAWRWHQFSTSQRIARLSQVPGVGHLVRLYYGYYLCLNTARLLKAGLSLHEIIELFQQLPAQALLSQLANSLSVALPQGRSLSHWINRQPYIPQECVLLIQRGTEMDHLDVELATLSDLLYDRLVASVQRYLGLVQPVLFLGIAGTILQTYLTLLLPMYSTLQGGFK